MDQDDVTVINYSQLQQNQSDQLDQEEDEKSRPEYYGEMSDSGSAPDPGLINEETVLERAQEAGLYTENSEENQDEVDLEEEVDEAENNRRGLG